MDLCEIEMEGVMPVPSHGPRNLTTLKYRHLEICPRTADTEAECLVCEMLEHLRMANNRYRRYSDGIGAAIGDSREKRHSGEPACSDAEEIRRMKAKIANLRRQLDDLTTVSP